MTTSDGMKGSPEKFGYCEDISTPTLGDLVMKGKSKLQVAITTRLPQFEILFLNCGENRMHTYYIIRPH